MTSASNLLHLDCAFGREQLDDELARAAGRLAIEDRDRVLGIVSHELKNSLSAVLMGAAILAEELDPSTKQAGLASRVLRSARRMDGIVADLLDVARTRFGAGLEIEAAPTDAHEVCARVVEELQMANRGRNIRLEVGGGARGQWDGKRLEQVVSNLVANALQHGAEDSPVTVTSRGLATEWTLAVHNQGEPIPPDLVPRLFAPFTRARPSATAKGSRCNLGIGLYVAHQVVLAHGGTIEVVSSAGDGTWFVVRLPRGRADDAIGAEGAEGAEGAARAASDG